MKQIQKMSNYKISIIIPSFSPKTDYIKECFDSIQKQTLQNELFEVVVILNGERNPYYQQISELLKKYSFNFNLFYTDMPGVSNARNIGINHSNSAYLCFIDDDDIISDNYLEQLLSIANPGVLAVSNVLAFRNGDISMVFKDYLSQAFLQSTCTKSIFQNRKFFSSACGKLIFKDDIQNKQFNAKFFLGEDSLFMASISNRITKIEKANVDVVYYRRIRESSASRKRYSRSFILKNKIQLVKEYLRIYFSDIFNYNPLFFCSRIFAVCRQKWPVKKG